ncbi:hypothetical protein A8990_11422 [Paenibacillus taihuensis]|uniref:FlgN protein n=1 Tax=Paenibacillus taihuensis TaxID=1156355 RepID=A0A3D9RYH9_9BACL|nr:hypothetical protein [Paenibacillus taihuensis]REE84488.1 hypothetical protein A8990_11422 [Paenibacillus taihuensis]
MGSSTKASEDPGCEMNVVESVQELLVLLNSTAQEILQLDLENEAATDRLEQLQSVQSGTRQQIDELCKANGMPIDKRSLRELLIECVALEKQIAVKLSVQRGVLNEHMSQIKKAEMARSRYHQTYTQAEGYFLDAHQ